MSDNNMSSKISGSRLILPFVLAVAGVLAAFFLILVLSPAGTERDGISDVPAGQSEAKALDMEKIEADYKAAATMAVRDYAAVISKERLSTDDVEKIKQRLLAIKVPTKFKELHISLVMAMVKMESFLGSGSKEDRLASEKTISDAKKNYSWLD